MVSGWKQGRQGGSSTAPFGDEAAWTFPRVSGEITGGRPPPDSASRTPGCTVPMNLSASTRSRWSKRSTTKPSDAHATRLTGGGKQRSNLRKSREKSYLTNRLSGPPLYE